MPCASISISCLSQDFSCPSKVSFKSSKAVFNASVCSFALLAPLIQPHRALTPFPRRLSNAPRATIITPIPVETIAVLRIFQAPAQATVAAVLANCAVVIAFISATLNLFCFELSIIVANLPFNPLLFNSVAAVLATVAVVAAWVVSASCLIAFIWAFIVFKLLLRDSNCSFTRLSILPEADAMASYCCISNSVALNWVSKRSNIDFCFSVKPDIVAEYLSVASAALFVASAPVFVAAALVLIADAAPVDASSTLSVSCWKSVSAAVPTVVVLTKF